MHPFPPTLTPIFVLFATLQLNQKRYFYVEKIWRHLLLWAPTPKVTPMQSSGLLLAVLFRNIPTCSGAHPTSYSVRTKVYLYGMKRTGREGGYLYSDDVKN